MIKNLAIGGVVGLLFMAGGFFGGLHFVHIPAPKKIAAVSATAKAPAAVSRDAISIDALRKTSQNMMDVNQALQARELAVAAREKKAREREDELDAERAALDRSHAKFKELYAQFEQRLQLVTTNESDQMQRQLTIYTTMDPAEAADLMRALDDGTIVRLFSMMDTKPLANLVSAWKSKYPADSIRLLTALTQMGTVMPQDKIALSDPAAPASDANAAPAPAPASGAAPASTDAAANTPPPDVGAPANASASDTGAPASTQAGDSTASAPTDAAAAPTADPSSASDAPAPDASSTSGSASTPDSTSPSPAAPASAASPSLAPPPDASAGQGTEATPSTTSALGVPGETAAEAAAIAQRRTGHLSADISDVSNDRAY